jgi:hypothetical protein
MPSSSLDAFNFWSALSSTVVPFSDSVWLDSVTLLIYATMLLVQGVGANVGVLVGKVVGAFAGGLVGIFVG